MTNRSSMRILEISECFPNKFKPVTGEFILQHAKALSEFCSLTMLVPLRLMPPRELFKVNPFRFIRNIYKWYRNIYETKNISEGNLEVVYLPYFSLPKPYFDRLNEKMTEVFFYNGFKKCAESFNPDIIYCNWINPWSNISYRLSREFRKPFVIDHHEDIPTLKKLNPDNYREQLNKFENADKIIVHSTLNKTELENENLKLKEVKIIYLGQNFNITQSRKVFNYDEPRIVCVSHLYEPRKNIDVLIKAFDNLNKNLPSKLTIAGDGSLKSSYEELSASLPSGSSISFRGSLSQDEIGNLLDESDIFVLPSYPEAFGIVLIEAIAKGLPVVTCRGNGGGEELLKLGYPVILAEPGSSENLSGKISGLVNDREKMDLMSVTGKNIARRYFSWKINAEETYGFLKTTLDEFYGKNKCAE